MRSTSRILTIAAAALASHAAWPQSGIGSFEPGIYISARGGAAVARHSDLSFDAAASNGNSLSSDRADTVGIAAIAMGRHLKAAPLRLELELSYQGEATTTESFELTSPPAAGAGFARQFVDSERIGLMTKLYLEHRGERGSLFAFGGVGSNYLSTEARQTTVQGGAAVSEKLPVDEDSEFELTWSVGAGTTFKFSEKHSFELMYEYMHVGDLNLRGDGSPVPATTTLEGDLSSHNIWIGYRFD